MTRRGNAVIQRRGDAETRRRGETTTTPAHLRGSWTPYTQPLSFPRVPASPRPRVIVSPSHLVSRSRRSRRRGIILPLALMVIGLLAVLAARVVFRSNADVAAMHAAEAAQQARWAAEAGIQKSLSILQGCPTCQPTDGPTGMDAWYNNPKALQAIIVQSPNNTNGIGSEAPSAKPSSQNPAVWRFSVVGNDPLVQANTASIRYGLTDEASKLNVNIASQVQLASLIRQVIRDQTVEADDLAKAIHYYCHPKPPVGKEDQAEESYYRTLDPPYSPKYAAFGSVEELLMVRGMNGRILYGEDWNRNGMLDAEENDGDTSFPPDNGDSLLDRGLYPFLTVWSSEPNLNSRNQPRANVNDKNAKALANTGLTLEQQAEITLRTQKKNIASLLELLEPVDGRSTPFTKDDLALILDELTVSKKQTFAGLVNINTAPAEVLEAIGFSDQEAHQILTVRAGLSSEERSSVAWLVEQNVIDTARLGDFLGNSNTPPTITARSFQYHVEAVGFADHVGTFSRLEAIIKMQSPLPIPQVVYWRDLSSLGLGWPVRAQEGSTIVVNRNG